MKFVLMTLLATGLAAQQIDLSSLDKFAQKTSESVNVNLDGEMLKFASGALSGQDAKERATKGLLSGIKGIHVRTFEFSKPGEFAQSDLDPIRRQLASPNWKRVVEVKDQDETVEVFFFVENGERKGMTVLTAGSKELVVVNLVGTMDLASLGALAGQFGIPNIQSGFSGAGATSPQPKKSTAPPKKDDDEE